MYVFQAYIIQTLLSIEKFHSMKRVAPSSLEPTIVDSFQHVVVKNKRGDGSVLYCKTFRGQHSWWNTKKMLTLCKNEIAMTKLLNRRYLRSYDTFSMTTRELKGYTCANSTSCVDFDSIAKLLATIHSVGVPFPSYGTQQYQRTQFSSRWFGEDDPSDIVVLHGDFHLGNVFVKKNKARAIDFEEATIGDRYWDLAEMCRSIILSRCGETEDFLECYSAHACISVNMAKVQQFMNLIADRNRAFNDRIPPNCPKVNCQMLTL